MGSKKKELIKIIKEIKKHISVVKSKDLASKIDVFYNSSSILYTLLFSFNISFMLSMRLEEFMRRGVAIVSDKNISTKLDEINIICDEVLRSLKSIKE